MAGSRSLPCEVSSRGPAAGETGRTWTGFLLSPESDSSVTLGVLEGPLGWGGASMRRRAQSLGVLWGEALPSFLDAQLLSRVPGREDLCPLPTTGHLCGAGPGRCDPRPSVGACSAGSQQARGRFAIQIRGGWGRAMNPSSCHGASGRSLGGQQPIWEIVLEPASVRPPPPPSLNGLTEDAVGTFQKPASDRWNPAGKRGRCGVLREAGRCREPGGGRGTWASGAAEPRGALGGLV